MNRLWKTRSRLKGISIEYILIYTLILNLCFRQDLAHACGVNAHTWISDSAICQLPVGSELQLLMSRQDLVDLVRIGSSFPDSGYPIDQPYAEYAHWSPFVENCVRRFQERYPPSEPLSEEGLREAAFLLGAASHGLEDELFDTQFLRWTFQEDGVDQEEIDGAVDFFIVADGHTVLRPNPELPLATVLEALHTEGISVTEDEIHRGYGFIQLALNLTDSPIAANNFANQQRPQMPWSATHYLDPDITGSLAYEPRIISKQLEVNWARLRGHFESQEALIALSPDPLEGERLELDAVNARLEAGWITLYFGIGVDVMSIQERISLLNEQGENLSFEWRSTRWGGGEGLTRLFQLRPNSSFMFDQRLTIQIEPGVILVGDVVTTERWERMVQTSCQSPPCETSMIPRVYGGQTKGCWVMETNHTEGGTQAGSEADHHSSLEMSDQAGENLQNQAGEDYAGVMIGMELEEKPMNMGISERQANQGGCSQTQSEHSLSVLLFLLLTICLASYQVEKC